MKQTDEREQHDREHHHEVKQIASGVVRRVGEQMQSTVESRESKELERRQNAHVGIRFVAGQNELNLHTVTISGCPREVFRSLTFEEVPDSLRKPVNTKI